MRKLPAKGTDLNSKAIRSYLTNIESVGDTNATNIATNTASIASHATSIAANSSSINEINNGSLAASKAEVQDGATNLKYVSPGTFIYSGVVPKGWVYCDTSGNILASENVFSVTKNGTGDFTITWDFQFVTANYGVSGSIDGSLSVYGWRVTSRTTTTTRININDINFLLGVASAVDAKFTITVFGEIV